MNRLPRSIKKIHGLALGATLSILALGVSSAGAKELRYKDYPFEIRPGDRITIQNFHGAVRLVGSGQTPKTAILKARKTISDKATPQDQAKFDALSFVVRRDGNLLNIELKGPLDRKQWSEWMKGTSPELSIDLEAPSVPVEVALHAGQVSIQNWREAVAVSMTTGQIKTSGGEGALKSMLQHGDIKIENQRGPIEVDTYNARVSIMNSEGQVDLTNFAGETHLNGLKSRIEVLAQGGAVNVAKSQGSMDFTNGRGLVSLTSFEGPVKGTSELGAVSLSVEGEAEVHIETNQAAVTVKAPEDSGAQIRLKTDEGTLGIPDSARAGAALGKTFTGKLNGEGPKGGITVKSKSGPIRIKI